MSRLADSGQVGWASLREIAIMGRRAAPLAFPWRPYFGVPARPRRWRRSRDGPVPRQKGEGSPFRGPPYGDTKAGQKQIKEGYYARCD